MKFSLISVFSLNNDGPFKGTFNGTWVQDHHGTLETAIERAKGTEEANGNRLDIAVVEKLPNEGGPIYGTVHWLTRLDTQRVVNPYVASRAA